MWFYQALTRQLALRDHELRAALALGSASAVGLCGSRTKPDPAHAVHRHLPSDTSVHHDRATRTPSRGDDREVPGSESKLESPQASESQHSRGRNLQSGTAAGTGSPLASPSQARGLHGGGFRLGVSTETSPGPGSASPLAHAVSPGGRRTPSHAGTGSSRHGLRVGHHVHGASASTPHFGGTSPTDSRSAATRNADLELPYSELQAVARLVMPVPTSSAGGSLSLRSSGTYDYESLPALPVVATVTRPRLA